MMNGKKKKPVVLRLRFPEFRDAGEWEVKPFTKVSDTVMGVSPKSNFYNEDGIGLPLIQGNADIKNGLSAPRIFTSEIIKECCKGDILLSVRAPVGTVAKSVHEACIGRGIAAIRANNNNSQEFLYQWLISFEPYWGRISQGGTFDAINSEDIKRLLIPIPPKKEQKKIADCLSSLDEMIELETKRVKALKQHKKGLMQQLFPREGETTPRLRFPEFSDAGEWEEKILGDVVTSVKTGKLDANAIVENGKYRFYTCAKTYYHIDHYAFEGEALLIAGNGAYLGYIHHYIGKFNAYQRTYVLQNFKTNVLFLKHLLQRYLPTRISLEKKDGNTPYIVLSTITEMPLLIPMGGEEQQKIADCLSSLDELIELQSQKVDALKQHKKGLMQQLFPQEVV